MSNVPQNNRENNTSSKTKSCMKGWQRMEITDILELENLIEICLKNDMSKKDAIENLYLYAKIEPLFTRAVWENLERNNPEFFRAYYMRNALIGQIVKFNELLEKQAQLTWRSNLAGQEALGNSASTLDATCGHIFPARLFLRVPVGCSCADGIRKSLGVRYRARHSDTLASIADSVYAGLVSADQLREANAITDPAAALEVGQSLAVPLPCTCFNGTDNALPAVYLSYVVRPVDSLGAIAARYATTVTDLMNVNAMGSTAIKAGDILAVPLPDFLAIGRTGMILI